MSHDVCTDLVLLPGWSLPERLFADWLPLPAARWRMTCLPLPPAESLQDMATRLLDTAPPRALWCGFSLGGMVALQAAAIAPSRVDGVLALAANACFVSRPGWPQAMNPDTFAAFAAGLDADVATTLARFDGLQCRGSATARAELRELRERRASQVAVDDTAAGYTVSTDAAGLRAGLRALRDGDLRASLPRIACPVAWLLAGEDALVPAAVAADLRACMPAAAVTVIDGASHLNILRQPARIAAALDTLIPTRKSS